MKKADVIIGVDVGGTHVRLGVVDESRRLLAVDSFQSALIDDAKDGPARLLDLLEERVARLCRDELRTVAFAIGFPSTISRDRRRVIQTPNIHGFDNLAIVDLLEDRFSVRAFLEKDVTFLLANDIEELKLDKAGTIIGIYLGTGIGNSIFMNGKFFTGKNGAAGEIGHIHMHGAERRCGCGNIGCIETEASGRRLAEITAEHFPGEHVSKVFAHHGEDEAIRSFLEWLSIPLATEINILDPDEVVIGGGIVRMQSFPREGFQERILAHVRKPIPHAGLSIRFSQGDAFAGILGGAQIALSSLAKRKRA